MSVDYLRIGQRIKAKRKSQGKTQENLAEALSVSVGYISQIERGVTKISLDTLSEISVFLGCELTEFLAGVTPGQKRYLSSELQEIYRNLNEEKRSMLLEIAEVILKHQ